MQPSQKSILLAVPALLLCALLYSGCSPSWFVERAIEDAGDRWDVALSSGGRLEAVWLQGVTPDSLEISADFIAEKRKRIPLDSITGLQENEIRRETRSSIRVVTGIASLAAIATGVVMIAEAPRPSEGASVDKTLLSRLLGSVFIAGGTVGLVITLTSSTSPRVYDLSGKEKSERYKIIKEAIDG